MRIGLGLCVLGLLLLSVLAQAAAEEVQPGVLVFCDDPSVEKSVNSAVETFNQRMSTGNILALYQTLSAVKSESSSGSVYSLQFTTRRSNCPVGSNTSWTDCEYGSSGHKVIKCNTTVLMTETGTDVQQVECELDDPVVPGKAACMGCPMEIDPDSEDLKVPLSVAISKFNSESDSTHLFNLNNVGHATRQIIAGLRFQVKFDMRKTVCAKAEHADLNDLCVFDDQDLVFANCNSTVDLAPWRHQNPQANNDCEPGPLPPQVFTRRRPAGWSPLRNIFIKQPSSAPPPTTAAPQESSEEEIATTVMADPDPANQPFHCPSKPWKPWNQPATVKPEAPTEAAAAEGFSDLDLLG